MELNEAIKRIRQETAPCTYNMDFDKNECLKVIEDSIKKKDDTIQNLKEHLIKWDDMLQHDGINSKAIVRDEIEAILEDINGDSSSNNTNL